MTLLGDLVSAFNAAQPQQQGQPRVPYTAEADSYSTVGNSFLVNDRGTQLQATTGESTLFSALQLIAQETAAVKWYGERKVANPKPEQEPERVTPEQNLAVKLWDQPNRFMTGRFVRTMCTWHYRAVGEVWWVVDWYGKPGTGLPRSFWPVRPDRMWPVPDPDDYLVGYIYIGPDGTRVPLELDEVLSFKFPHPMDPHRGLGAVQALGRGLGISRSSQEWIAKFFDNDASPGGIIQIPEGLEDGDYDRLRKRWNEQHRGAKKAHRVAILEWGTWTPRSFNMRDMQFAELRGLTRDQILETLRIHKHKMGISDTVNLANAHAADATFARSELVPNLEEWSTLANGPYLGMFGAPGAGIQLCYENPVPEDREDDRADRTARINDAQRLIVDLGVRPEQAFDFVGMPVLDLIEAQTQEPPAQDVPPDAGVGSPAAAPDPVGAAAGGSPAFDPMNVAQVIQKLYLGVKGNSLLEPVEGRIIAAAAGAPIDPENWEDPEPAPPPQPLPEVPASSSSGAAPPMAGDLSGEPGHPPGGSAGRASRRLRAQLPGDVDLSQLDEDWQTALDEVMAKWPGILDDQYSALASQVRELIDAGNLAGLVDLAAPDSGAAEALTGVMVLAAASGAAAIAREAAAQGVAVAALPASRASLETVAALVTGLMRASVATSAAREALRLAGTNDAASGQAVAEGVRAFLDNLTDSQPRQYLGGAVTAAQNQGRFAALDTAPPATYYASEVLDANTCRPCSRVDGTRYEDLVAAKEDYPLGGYRNCLGAERCRGTIIAVWDKGGDGS